MIQKDDNKAVVLLSGGLDSFVAAGLAREEGLRLYALTIDYGQRHRIELESARAIAASLGVERHVVLPLDLTAFGGSALTVSDIAVPKDGVGAMTDARWAEFFAVAADQGVYPKTMDYKQAYSLAFLPK